MKDTGDEAWVPEEERRDYDVEGSFDDASDEGLDDDLDDVYNDPGEVVEDDLI